jgi:hypothetical protein
MSRLARVQVGRRALRALQQSEPDAKQRHLGDGRRLREARGASAWNQARRVIRQVAGTYAENWQISASGTANNPIVLRRVNSLDSNVCGYQKVSLDQRATYDLLRPFRPFVTVKGSARCRTAEVVDRRNWRQGLRPEVPFVRGLHLSQGLMNSLRPFACRALDRQSAVLGLSMPSGRQRRRRAETPSLQPRSAPADDPCGGRNIWRDTGPNREVTSKLEQPVELVDYCSTAVMYGGRGWDSN